MPARIKIAIFTVCAGLAAHAQQAQPQQRDLDIVKVPPAKPPAAKAPAAAPGTPARAAIPRSYALVIGISRYPNLEQKWQLNFSERDAEGIYTILISPEGGNFRAENVHRLIGAQATLANIRRELEVWLPSVSKPDDRVLIYFAGHGFIYDDKGFLAPVDFDMRKAEATGYPMDSLGKVIGGRIQAKWKVLLTDSCHSGAITPETTNEKVNQKLLSLNTSLFSLTASRDRERSFESADFGGGHGVFTYYVMKGMEGEADENGDGIVNADELGEYVRRNVRQVTKGEQNPTSDRGSFDADMLLAYNPSGVKPGAPPEAKDGTLIFESNMDGVELWVDDKPAGLLKKGEPFRLPGLQPRPHTIKGVKQGYEPDGPREEMVYPGQESTVKINILILRRHNKAAVDAFDKGVQFYTKGFKDNYQKAAELFQHAVELDPKYSAAYLYLGRTQDALFEPEKAVAAMKKAIEIDPDYLDARFSLGAVLLNIGNVDESVREFNYVIQHDGKNAQALSLLAQAYRMKGAYPEAIESARRAIAVAPGNPEAHFWLAEGLRMSGQWDSAKPEYDRYLHLSNFDSGLAGKLNYYIVGSLVGLGKKKRASQADIWRDLRSLAYFGLCDCDKRMKAYDSAIANCSKALTYDPTDPYIHYNLGLIYAYKAQSTGSREPLPAASKHFRTMLALNSDMAEAAAVRKMLKSFDDALSKP